MNLTIPTRLWSFLGKALVFLLFLLCTHRMNAQGRLEGQVIDATTEAPLPFVNISILGTIHGTLSGQMGHFMLPVRKEGRVKFSSMGYNDVEFDLATIDTKELLNVKMEAKIIALNEVSIKADFAFDKYLYKQVLKHKRKNQSRVISVGDYQVKKKTLMMLAVEDSSSLGKYAQQSLVTNKKWGKQFLPVYKSTGVHQVSVQGKRRNTKEISRETEGIFDMLNQQLEELVLQKLSSDFDFYRNQITIFDHGFISPLSATALLHYNIYLTDSLHRKDQLLYKFNFYPKDKKACLFQGTLWVDSETFALASISTTLPKTAGINYVKSMNIDVNYEKQAGDGLFYRDQKVRTLLTVMKPVDEGRAHKEDDASNDMLSNKNILVLEKTQFALPVLGAKKADTYYLHPHHKTDIDSMEQVVASSLKTMRQSPKVRLADAVIGTCLTGYYGAGIIDVGPISDIYTTNFVEGNRFTLPLRTNAKLSDNYCIGSYIGIGSESKEFKYGAKFSYLLPTNRRGILSMSYDNDYLSTSHDQFLTFVKDNAYSKGNGNLISAITAKERNPYMLDVKKASVEWVQDLHDGMELTVAPYYSSTQTTAYLPLVHEGMSYSGYDNVGALLNIRFSFGQKAEDYFFQRFYYINSKPVINVSFDMGKMAVDGRTNHTGYLHMHAALKNRFALGRCNFRMLVNVGRIAGKVPYTILQKPSGTHSLGYARYGYNLLDFSSFAHNVYTNAYVSCNFGGVVLNHVPLLNKLHLREVASVKCYYGRLTKHYKGLFDIPTDFQNEMTKPYMEVGVGVGNLFKIMRIEYVHLINNKQAIGQYAMKHGVRMKIEVEF